MNRQARRLHRRNGYKPLHEPRAQPSPLLDTLMARPDRPLSEKNARDLLLHAHSALDALQRDVQPQPWHWRVLADMCNVMEMLARLGHLEGDTDLNALAQATLANAVRRHKANPTTAPLRLAGPGIGALRVILDGYDQALHQLSERDIHAALLATTRHIAAARKTGGTLIEC
ncbi:MAG: hypothetical protein ACRCV9_16280 [Burkholderiaceae bacterium]